MKSILLLVLALILLALPATASLSPDFMIQGVLTDQNGDPLPDDEYIIRIKLWTASSGGNTLHSQAAEVFQNDGVFTTSIENVYWETFDNPLWVEFTMDGEEPMIPRIRLMPTPAALRASTVDPANAVVRINSAKGDVTLVGGANVTVTNSYPNTITIDAVAGAGGDDGDWTISGNDMYHANSGAVAIGTSAPHPYGDSVASTTLQVKALFSPTLALDAQAPYPNNQLHRWTMTGTSTGIKFNHSNDYSNLGTTLMSLTDTATGFNNTSGAQRIRLQTEADMDDGGVIYLYGSTSANPTLTLDGNQGGDGGRIIISDEYGSGVITATSDYNNTGIGRVITPVLEITGGSDLSEQFDIGNASALPQPGMVVSIDPDNPGQLTLCGQSYDRKVAGVISGAGGVNTGMVMGQRGTVADGELPVALVGRVYVWADASDGPIEPGDLLTTAERPGHAMKVSDHQKATGAILGKAMSGLDEGQGLILTLVTLQ